MPKWNGGVIGVANNPTISSAKGIWSLSEATKAIRAGLWPPSSAGADPYFENVTMLLSANGTDGTNNSSFLDSSGNGNHPSRNGNTTQGTFTPFSKVSGRWATFFNGSSDTLISSGTPINIGTTGDFTMELWIYPVAVSGAFNVIVNTNSTGGFGGGVNSNGTITFGRALIATDGTTSNAVNFNQWNHVAWVRSSGTLKIYINGTSGFSAANSSSYPSGAARLGSDNNNTIYFNGYMSNFRFTTTAVYTANFTPSTIPLTAISGTTILTCQSNRYIDNSASALTFTIQGAPSIQTFSPFPTLTAYASGTNGGSGYFDAFGDYLSCSQTTPFSFGTGDFCVETWAYITQAQGSGVWYPIFDTRPQNSTNGAYPILGFQDNTRYVFAGPASSPTISTYAVPIGSWVQVVWTRVSGATRCFINGVLQLYNGSDTTNYTVGGNGIRIGAEGFNSSPNATFPGYFSDYRVLKGGIPSGYSTSSTTVGATIFTPPTAPLTAITNTSLLCNFTNGGIVDAAMSNDLETVGNAQISTTQSKFGGASMYFDGNDKCVMPYTQNFNLGTTYTIEAWIYPTTVSGYQRIFDIVNSATSSPAFLDVALNGTALVSELRTANGGGVTTISGGTVSANTWSHVALSVSAGSAKLFLNGTQVGSTTTLSALPDQNFVGIGGIGNSLTIDYLTGYIDDLRVTKGYARYTANFTAPVAPFVAFGD